MRHSALSRPESQDAFTDLLFNALLGFAFMFVIAFALISYRFIVNVLKKLHAIVFGLDPDDDE